MTAPKPENSAQILDDAFDFLEKIVTEGFAPEEDDPIARTFGMKPDLETSSAKDAVQDTEPQSEQSAPTKDALTDETKPDQESERSPSEDATESPPDRLAEEASEEPDEGENRARDAWTTFSRGQHPEAIEKYRVLIRDQIETDQVRSDLQTLGQLFPEDDALSELIRSLDE